MEKYFNYVQDTSGNAVGSATVKIYDAGTSDLASIFSDEGSTSISGSAITTDANGFFEFYAADGDYKIEISKTGITTQTIDDVTLSDPYVDDATDTAGARTFSSVTTTGDVGIGTASPSVRLHALDSAQEVTRVEGSSASSSTVPGLESSWRSTATPSEANAIAVRLSFYGDDDAAANDQVARIDIIQTDIAAATQSAAFDFTTIQSNARASRMRVGAGVFHVSATGTDKGNNTINFGAVYDDNVLLSCYPFDQALDGALDQTKWDGKVPNRYHEAVTEEQDELDADGNVVMEDHVSTQTDDEGNKVEVIRKRPKKKTVETKAAYEEVRTHEGAAKFKARIGTEYDPLDIDKYAQHWKDKRHLTSMPNEAKYDPNNDGSGKLDMGNWVQKLIETVEIQAIHIEALNQRLKALEAA